MSVWLRKDLELFANLRPAICYPALAASSSLKQEVVEGLDILIVRELTGGIYFGPRQEQGDGDSAYDTMLYSADEVKRVADIAFRAAQRRRGKVTSVDKANVLANSRVWREVAHEVAAGYPDIEYEDVLVDAMRGRHKTWTRIRVNLQHVPEHLRPSQEPLDPAEDPADEWKGVTGDRPPRRPGRSRTEE